MMPIKSIMLELLDPKRVWLTGSKRVIACFCFLSSSCGLVFRYRESKTGKETVPT